MNTVRASVKGDGSCLTEPGRHDVQGAESEQCGVAKSLEGAFQVDHAAKHDDDDP